MALYKQKGDCREDRVHYCNNRLQIIKHLFAIAAVFTAVFCVLFYNIAYENDYRFVFPKSAEILFVGDLMFDRGIRYYAEKNGGNDFIFSKISDFLKSNDLVVANLEGTITKNQSVSAGTAPGSTNNYYFTFDPSVAKTLYDNNIKMVSLGNNHILNFGEAGLVETKKYLDIAKVGYFGAPDYPKSTQATINGIKITFINYNEFADSNTIEDIKKARNFSDIIIVYAHWGVEYQKNPTEGQINLAHQFIDEGADLVIGSHPHVIQTTEVYKNKKIYYSLGNFIFDQYFSEDVRNGMGVVVKISANKKLSFTEYNFYLASQGQTILLSPAFSPKQEVENN